MPPDHAETISDTELQRAEGSARVVLDSDEHGTRVVDVMQRSPLRLLFPRPVDTAVPEVVVVNTSGGIAGGDRLEMSVTTRAGATILVSSQAAEKVYRSLSEPASVVTRLTAHPGSRLAWLPQETIVFDRARLSRQTRIELHGNCEFVALECLVLGRSAHGEKFLGGEVTERWQVSRDGRLIWADAFRIAGDTFGQLREPALLANSHALATLIYSGSDPEGTVERLREVAPSMECQCAVTLVAGLVVVRLAAGMAWDLKCALHSVLQELDCRADPTPFGVPKMWSC